MTSQAPGGRVTRKRAQLQKDKEPVEKMKNVDDAEPKTKEEKETKGGKEENLGTDIQQPHVAPNANGTATLETKTAPSGAPPAIKVEPPPGAHAGPRPVFPAPGPPQLRPPFNPALAGAPPPYRPPVPGAPGAPPGSGMPVGLPPGLAPALRGASPAQIAEMIAAARQIQQQRLLQMQQQLAAGGGAPSTAAGAGAPPRPPVPLANIPVPTGQPSRPFLVTARPAGGPNQAGPSTAAAGAAAGFPPPPPGGILPPQAIGTLKRKSDDLTAAAGVAMGFPGHLPPPNAFNAAQQQQQQAPAGTAPAPGLSEEVATSAGEQQQQQHLATGAAGVPATSISAHFTYGNSGELYGDEDGSGGSGAGLDADGKKVRLVWTQELHNRFINALSHLGLKHAVPKNILTMMNVEGMTRENVASHLQKYRLYLKKIGGHSEKDRVDADVLQALHEQNVQHMAAQQAMQQSMAAVTGGAGGGHQQFNPHLSGGGGGFMGGFAPQHQYTTAGGVHGGVDGSGAPLQDAGTAAAPMGAHPGVGSGSGGGHPSSNGGPPTIYIAPGDIVEGIPVSDIQGPEPVSPTVTAAVEAGGKFNPQGWQYPPLPMPDHLPSSSMPPSSMAPPSGAVLGMPHHHQTGGGGGFNLLDHRGQQQQQEQYHQFNYHHHHHHSNLGDLAAAAVAGEDHLHHHHHHQSSHDPAGGPAAAVWTDNGEGWAEGWPHEDYADPQEDINDGNRIIDVKNEGEGGGEGAEVKSGGASGGKSADGGGGSGGSGHNNITVENDDEDDPPLIPAVPSAGELHHMVERVPMRMADPA